MIVHPGVSIFALKDFFNMSHKCSDHLEGNASNILFPLKKSDEQEHSQIQILRAEKATMFHDNVADTG